MAEGQPNNPFAFLSLIHKIFANIFGNNNNTNSSDYNEKSVISVDGEEASRTKTKTPAVVRFPKTQPEVPPLKLENEDADNDTNPIILWQIYALGGFIVLKWAWEKWQARKANTKKDSSGTEQHTASDSDPSRGPTPTPAED
ncbi:uncharacterized protein LOC130809464 [Amaranthus tricolor]|uniref:uncharacterized protein LOC130809464 n=1 Tax=Amaranthus tricolor TaxID=29722 RepID=UPI00258D394F|nr:uncharacterized protein LOC130809464 [Amaranthus tricolor]